MKCFNIKKILYKKTKIFFSLINKAKKKKNIKLKIIKKIYKFFF